MKLRNILASVLVVAGGFVGTANAAIDLPTATGGSELVFSALLDDDSSVAFDLGVTLDQIASGSYSNTWNALPTNIVQWTVFGSKQAGAAQTDGAISVGATGTNVFATGNTSGIANVSGKIFNYFDSLNGVSSHDVPGDGNSSQTGGTSNTAHIQNIVTSGGFILGTDAAVAAPGVVSMLDFAIYQQTGIDRSGRYTPTGTQVLALDTFTLSNGVLSYGSQAPIPVPAAVWLFGSALIGLVGAGRRKAV